MLHLMLECPSAKHSDELSNVVTEGIKDGFDL